MYEINIILVYWFQVWLRKQVSLHSSCLTMTKSLSRLSSRTTDTAPRSPLTSPRECWNFSSVVHLKQNTFHTLIQCLLILLILVVRFRASFHECIKLIAASEITMTSNCCLTLRTVEGLRDPRSVRGRSGQQLQVWTGPLPLGGCGHQRSVEISRKIFQPCRKIISSLQCLY